MRTASAVLVLIWGLTCLQQIAIGEEVQVNDIESIISKGFIERWLVCGPFPPDGDEALAASLRQWRVPLPDTDFLKDVTPENLIEPRLGVVHPNASAPDGKAVWTSVTANSSLVDVGTLYPSSGAGVVYAACYIGSPTDRIISLDFQTPSGTRVWFNHAAVEPSPQQSSETAGVQNFIIRVPRGFNLLLMKFGGVTFPQIEKLTGRPQEDVRLHVSRTAESIAKSSGLAFSIAVSSVTPIGTSGVGLIGQPKATGYFRGAGETPRQEIGVTLFNASSTPAADVRALVESAAPVASSDAIKLTVLQPGEKRQILFGITVSQTMVGSEVNAKATLIVADQRLDLPFKFTVGQIPSPDEKIFVVPGFHADPVWIEDQRDYMVALLSSAEQNLLITEVDPAYGVYLSELSYLKSFYDTNPNRRAYLRKLIQEGRVGTGGAYNQAVEKLISGEAFIKNILYGHLFHEGVLGDSSTVYMCWDVFGHCAQLSQILAKSRHAGVVWSKAIRGFPPVFWHMSLDGTKLLHKRVPYGFDSDNKLDLRRQLYDQLKEQKSYGLSADVRFDAGDFKAPTAWFAGTCPELLDFRPPIVVSGSGAELYFDSVFKDVREKKLNLPVTARDMSYYHEGTGLTRADFKSANRIGENLLVTASSWATIANLMGAKYPDKALDKAWRQLLFGQHHDALTGTMCDRAYLDLMAGYREAIELGSELVQNATSYIAESVDTMKNAPSSTARAIVVFNPSSWTRTDYCAVQINCGERPVQGFALTDSAGQPMPFEVEQVERQGDGTVKSARIIFVADTVPSLGYKTYFLADGTSVSEPILAENVAIENEFFAVKVDPQKGGGIVSLVDKATRKEFIKQGDAPGNEIIALDEDTKRNEPPWEVYTTGGKMFSRSFPATVRAQKGPVTSRLIIEGDMRNCKRRQEIILYRGIRRIDFVTHLIDYTGAGEMFMVAFPTDLKKSEPVFEERFGAVVRKKSKSYMDHRTWQWRNYSGTGLRCAYQWLDASYSGILEFGTDGGSFPIGMVTLVIPHDGAVRNAALDLQECLINKGVFCTPWYDDGDIERRRNLPYEDCTQPVDMNEDLPYGTSFRITFGSPAANSYTAKLLANVEPDKKRGFEEQLATQGYAYLFVKDANVPEGWEPTPVLIVAGIDANGVQKAVDQLIADFAEDASIMFPATVNLTGDNSQVDRNGLALANVGTVLNSIENDGTVAMALMHTASWHYDEWGKPDRLPFLFVPEWKTNTFPYSVYPHSGNWRDAGVHKFGYEFNNPLVGTVAEIHRGTLPPEMSFLEVEPGNLIVTMLKPRSNPTAALQKKEVNALEDGVILRLYEATGAEAKASVKFFAPLSTAARADLLEKEIGQVRFSEKGISDTVGPFSIQTYSMMPSGAVPGVSKRTLGREKEPAQPVYTRFWRNNFGEAPIGYAPVNVTIEGDIQTGIHIGQGGVSINKVTVSITNDYTDAEVSGRARIITPATWRAIPSEFEYKVPAGGETSREVIIAFLQGTRTGLIKAQIEHDGQMFQDVFEVGDVKLNMAVKKADNQIQVTLNNPNDDTIEGQVDIITPVEAWSREAVGRFSSLAVTPRVIPVVIRGREQLDLSFTITASEPDPKFWAVVKLSYNGHVEYVPVPGLLRTQ